MTPNQLFIHGAIEQNMVPLCTPPQVSQPTSYLQQFRDHVRVPQLSFKPCSATLKSLDSVDCSIESIDLVMIYISKSVILLASI